MASDAVLDFERLLAPVPGDNPAGSPSRGKRSSETVDDANKARVLERSHLYSDGLDSQGQPLPSPDWGPVLTKGQVALADECKDLKVAAALVEALVRRHGFAGLRDGFRLVRCLVESFWDRLYPLPDEEDGAAARLAPLGGLDSALPVPISRVPITKGKSAGPFSAFDYQRALELDGISDPDKRSRREADPGAVTLQMFNRSVAETGPQFFRDLLDDLGQCLEELQGLGTVLEKQCQTDPNGGSALPSTSSLRTALEASRDVVTRISAHLLEAKEGEDGPGADAPAANQASATPGGTGKGDGVAVGQVRNREEAFQGLLRVAEFFKRTEPHSPVSYALEQAVRWGRMSLPDLLKELVPEEAVREQMFKRVGIVVKDEPAPP
jgi:type VI secretion system protein ImpA